MWSPFKKKPDPELKPLKFKRVCKFQYDSRILGLSSKDKDKQGFVACALTTKAMAAHMVGAMFQSDPCEPELCPTYQTWILLKDRKHTSPKIQEF